MSAAVPATGKPFPWKALGVAAVAALAVRLAVLPLTLGRVPLGDPYNYVVIARNMLAGSGMAIDDPQLVPNLSAFYPPLYPLVLAGFGAAAGLGQTAILTLNFLIDLATAAAVLWLGRLVNEDKASRIAAPLYLLWPTNVLLAPLAHKEGLVALLALLAVCTLIRAARRPAWQRAAAFGAVTGLATLAQPAAAPLSALFALVLYRMFEPAAWVRVMVVAVAATCAVMAPWWIRNYLVLGQFVPLTSAGGLGLWVGTSPLGTWVPAPPHLLKGNELDVSRAAFAEASRWIAAHPWEYLQRCLAKLVRGLVMDISAVHQLRVMTPQRPVPHYLLYLASVSHLAMLLTGVTAAILRKGLPARLLAACFAQIFLFQAWFEFSDRHAYFLAPFLLLTGVAGLASLLAGGRGGPGDQQQREAGRRDHVVR